MSMQSVMWAQRLDRTVPTLRPSVTRATGLEQHRISRSRNQVNTLTQGCCTKLEVARYYTVSQAAAHSDAALHSTELHASVRDGNNDDSNTMHDDGNAGVSVQPILVEGVLPWRLLEGPGRATDRLDTPGAFRTLPEFRSSTQQPTPATELARLLFSRMKCRRSAHERLLFQCRPQSPCRSHHRTSRWSNPLDAHV